MINHIKTLLANIPGSEAVGHDMGFYVDPTFIPVSADSRTEAIRGELVDQPVGARVVLDAVFSVISRIDLREHVEIYDTRILEDPVEDRPLFDGFGSDKPSVSFSVFYRKGVPEHLFSRVRDATTDAELQKLKELWVGSTDGHTGLAACILALVARLDFYRRNRPGA